MQGNLYGTEEGAVEAEGTGPAARPAGTLGRIAARRAAKLTGGGRSKRLALNAPATQVSTENMD